jgi:hypothetical protein
LNATTAGGTVETNLRARSVSFQYVVVALADAACCLPACPLTCPPACSLGCLLACLITLLLFLLQLLLLLWFLTSVGNFGSSLQQPRLASQIAVSRG